MILVKVYTYRLFFRKHSYRVLFGISILWTQIARFFNTTNLELLTWLGRKLIWFGNSTFQPVDDILLERMGKVYYVSTKGISKTEHTP